MSTTSEISWCKTYSSSSCLKFMATW
jgi:hypothetical protein